MCIIQVMINLVIKKLFNNKIMQIVMRIQSKIYNQLYYQSTKYSLEKSALNKYLFWKIGNIILNKEFSITLFLIDNKELKVELQEIYRKLENEVYS